MSGSRFAERNVYSVTNPAPYESRWPVVRGRMVLIEKRFRRRFGSDRQKFTARFAVRRRRRRWHFGQINLHLGAFAQLAFHPDAAAALANDIVTGGQPQTATTLVGFCGEEWFEQFRFHFLGHSASVIDHIDDNVVTCWKRFLSK